MVAIFVGLKWHLVTSRIRALPERKRRSVVIGLGLVVLLMAAAAFGISRLRSVPEAGYLVITGLFALQLVAWILAPMVAFGVDETLDPSRFALLPLRTSTLQRGLLVSSLVGYLPVANAIILIGAAIGLSFLGWMLPVALLCAALQLVTCVVFSRAASTSMATLMSSRRGRDLGMLVGMGVLVLYMLASLFLSSAGSGIGAGAQRLAEILSWSPPGSLASLPIFIAAGEWGRVARAVVIAGAFLALGWWWWSRALGRSMVTVNSGTAGSAPSHGLGSADAVADGVRNTARLVAGRDRTLMWRDPMRRLTWILAMFMSILWPLLVFRSSGAVYAAAFGAALFGSQAANQFGLDGSGVWLNLVAFGDRQRARGEIFGHALVVLIPSAVLVTVAVLVLAVVQDDWDAVPGALGVCLAVLTGAVATGSYLSATIPYAVPQSRKSMFASSIPSQKGRTFRSAFGTILGGLVIALPVGGLAVLGQIVDPVWGWVALVVGIAAPPFLMLAAIRKAADIYLESGPEIFEMVKAGDRV